jgi:pyruvate kinase
VAVSFAHKANDIFAVRNELAKHKAKAKVIAKIETKSAVENLESIIRASDAVMIARGDLAVEIGPEKVPIVGREIILLSRKHKKPVIMATQMMESMMTSTTPSRAEANDVATAVILGVDCLMLSGETAIGQFPVETVKMMKLIILSAEQYFVSTTMAVAMTEEPEGAVEADISQDSSLLGRLGQKTKLVFSRQPMEQSKILSLEAQTSVSFAALTLAEQLGARLFAPEIAYLTTDAPVESPWLRGYRVLDEMAFDRKKLKAYLRERSIGVLEIKKRGSDVVPEQLRKEMLLKGENAATLIVSRVGDAHRVLVVEPIR